MSLRQKLSIEEVDNGYIVRVIRTGSSNFKDPYEKPVKVYGSFEELIQSLVILRPASYEGHK